jgi:hypothetical protein
MHFCLYFELFGEGGDEYGEDERDISMYFSFDIAYVKSLGRFSEDKLVIFKAGGLEAEFLFNKNKVIFYLLLNRLIKVMIIMNEPLIIKETAVLTLDHISHLHSITK